VAVASTGEQEKDLFIHIFRELSSTGDFFESLSGILKETCEFFGFYSGFVYEADHKGEFHLCESYCATGQSVVESFSLDQFLEKEDLKTLNGRIGEIVYLNSRQNQLGARFLELFNAKTLIMVPVNLDEDAPIAFIGMMDRRRPIRLNQQEISDADAVLSVLAGHIKARAYRKRLEDTYQSLKTVVDHAGVDIYVVDFYTRELLFVNESLAAAYGGQDQVLGRRCWEIFSETRQELCADCPRAGLIQPEGTPGGTITWDNYRNGRWYHILSACFKWVDGRLVQEVSRFDITENKEYEALIRKMAEQDSLTSLYNKGKFLADLEESLRAGTTGGCLLFMDLDDFKKINDSIGHLEGDELLCRIGAFLRENESLLGVPYRYGGDEFVILAPGRTREEVLRLRDILLERFRSPWQLRNHQMLCRISIGGVLFPQGDKSAADIIESADQAMYAVKKAGKNGFKFV